MLIIINIQGIEGCIENRDRYLNTSLSIVTRFRKIAAVRLIELDQRCDDYNFMQCRE